MGRVNKRKQQLKQARINKKNRQITQIDTAEIDHPHDFELDMGEQIQEEVPMTLLEEQHEEEDGFSRERHPTEEELA